MFKKLIFVIAILVALQPTGVWAVKNDTRVKSDSQTGPIVILVAMATVAAVVGLLWWYSYSPDDILTAASEGRLDSVKYYVKSGKIDEKSPDGWTALIAAARNGKLNVVKYLVEHNAKIDGKRADGCSALFMAAFFGHLEIVKHLVERGAKVDEKNNHGWTARYVVHLLNAHLSNRPAIEAYLILAEDFYQVVANKVEPDNFIKKYCETQTPVVSKQNIADIRKFLHLGTREIADMFYAWCEKNKSFAVGDKWASGKAWMYFDLCKNIVANPMKKLFWYSMLLRIATLTNNEVLAQYIIANNPELKALFKADKEKFKKPFFRFMKTKAYLDGNHQKTSSKWQLPRELSAEILKNCGPFDGKTVKE